MTSLPSAMIDSASQLDANEGGDIQPSTPGASFLACNGDSIVCRFPSKLCNRMCSLNLVDFPGGLPT